MIKLTRLYVLLGVITGCCIIMVVFNIKRDFVLILSNLGVLNLFFLSHSIDTNFKSLEWEGTLASSTILFILQVKEAIQHKLTDLLRVRPYTGRIRSYSFSNALLRLNK